MVLTGNPSSIPCLLMILMRVLSVLSRTCDQTEYQVGNRCCPLCPPGCRVNRDCTEVISTSCEPCGEGTYLDKPNCQKQCLTCSPVICDQGLGLQVKQGCNGTSDSVCEALEGFFCSDFTSGSCSSANRHRTCGPGQYISRTGTWSSDAECSDCSSGSFSNGSSTSCQPHTQCETLKLRLIKAGTSSSDAECGEKIYPGEITGIVIGAVVGVILSLIGAAVLYLYIKKRKSRPVVLSFTRNQDQINMKTSAVEERFLRDNSHQDETHEVQEQL